jgi:conjugal transfer ATP-binding protein TraC
VAVLTADSLGYRGASDQDQQRWLTAFRRLLDGLDGPLEIVLRSQPGPGGVQEPLPTATRRDLDLQHLRELERSPESQRHSIRFVVPAANLSALRSALLELGSASELDAPALLEAPVADEVGRLRTAGGLQRTWYVQRFPGLELEPAWLHRFAPRGADVTVAAHLVPLPTAWIVAHLQRRLTAMRAARLQEAVTGDADPALAGALPAAQELQRQLVASEEHAFLVSVYVTLCAADDAALADGSRAIEAAARTLLCRLVPCTFRMLDGFVSSRALGLDVLQRGKILHTSAASTLFPWLDSDLREPEGLVVGRSLATGCPVQLDPFDQGRHANANIGVFGHSGAGKTYLMSVLALSAASAGVQVLVIDPEHEYGGLARELGGIDVPLALGSGVALNVLGLHDGALAREESLLGPAVADSLDLLAVICGGLDQEQRALAESAVRAAYAEVGQPLLADVARHLAPGSSLRLVLQRWVEGSLGTMFSRPTNIDLDAPVVVFGMRELREELVAPVHFLLAEALWSRIKTRRRRRLLFVDELGLLFEDATIRRFVVNLARRIRKYDGGLVFATQNPGDLLASEAGLVVATNPGIHFFGSLRAGEAVKVQRAFQLSESERGMLENARRGEFLVASGADRLPLRVVAPPWQADLIARVRGPSDPFV